MDEVLFESAVEGLTLAFRGKVRDLYELGDRLLIVANQCAEPCGALVGQAVNEFATAVAAVGHPRYVKPARGAIHLHQPAGTIGELLILTMAYVVKQILHVVIPTVVPLRFGGGEIDVLTQPRRIGFEITTGRRGGVVVTELKHPR